MLYGDASRSTRRTEEGYGIHAPAIRRHEECRGLVCSSACSGGFKMLSAWFASCLQEDFEKGGEHDKEGEKNRRSRPPKVRRKVRRKRSLKRMKKKRSRKISRRTRERAPQTPLLLQLSHSMASSWQVRAALLDLARIRGGFEQLQVESVEAAGMNPLLCHDGPLCGFRSSAPRSAVCSPVIDSVSGALSC